MLDKIFSSLQRAEVGRLAEGEPDAALPQKVRIPAPGAEPPQQNGDSQTRRRPSSLVEGLFGLDVQVILHSLAGRPVHIQGPRPTLERARRQRTGRLAGIGRTAGPKAGAVLQVPSPPDDEEAEAQTVKRSKGTGGAVVGRWQETPSRPGRNQSGSPSAPKPTPAKKLKDPSTIEMLQFTKLYHLVPAQVGPEPPDSREVLHLDLACRRRRAGLSSASKLVSADLASRAGAKAVPLVCAGAEGRL